MTTRVVGTCILSATSCALRGALFDVPFSGGSCPSTLAHIRFEWNKAVSSLTSGQQSDVAAASTMLQAKLNAEEACTDLRAVNYFDLGLGIDEIVETATAWLNGPTVAGKQRQMWSHWSKSRAAFSAEERTQLDAVVTMLSAYLASEEPLP